MAYRVAEERFPSSDGVHQCHATFFLPEGEVRGVVQLSHGMIEYVGRYASMAEALTAAGWVLAGNDHLGHGKTAENAEEYGFFAHNNGRELVLADLRRMTEILRERYPGKKLVLFGHSMGSFLARLYVTRYPGAVDAAVFCGTAGKNALAGVGVALSSVLTAVRGDRYRSSFIANLAFRGYNKKFDPAEGPSAWLTRDRAVLEEHDRDELATFRFTSTAYRELFRMVKELGKKKWYRAYPKNLPTLLVAGTMDPVGNYGEGPREVYQRLWEAGVSDLDIKLYEDCRHELYHENNRDEIFRDLIAWLEKDDAPQNAETPEGEE